MTDLALYTICGVAAALLWLDAREFFIAWYSGSEPPSRWGLVITIAQMVVNVALIVLALGA